MSPLAYCSLSLYLASDDDVDDDEQFPESLLNSRWVQSLDLFCLQKPSHVLNRVFNMNIIYEMHVVNMGFIIFLWKGIVYNCKMVKCCIVDDVAGLQKKVSKEELKKQSLLFSLNHSPVKLQPHPRWPMNWLVFRCACPIIGSCKDLSGSDKLSYKWMLVGYTCPEVIIFQKAVCWRTTFVAYLLSCMQWIYAIVYAWHTPGQKTSVINFTTCLGPELFPLISMSKSMLINKDFQTWHLIGWQHSRQPIRSHARKSLLTTMEFNIDFT